MKTIGQCNKKDTPVSHTMFWLQSASLIAFRRKTLKSMCFLFRSVNWCQIRSLLQKLMPGFRFLGSFHSDHSSELLMRLFYLVAGSWQPKMISIITSWILRSNLSTTTSLKSSIKGSSNTLPEEGYSKQKWISIFALESW